MIDIVGMHALAPAIIEFFFQRVTDELEPLAIEPSAAFVKIAHPYQNGCAVRHRAETFFAGAQGILSLLAVRNVARKASEHGRTLAGRPRDAEFNRHLCTV